MQDLKITPVESQTGDHRSNFEAEVAVKLVKNQVRAMLSTLEEKLRMKVSDKHPIMSWISRHAAYLMSRLKIGTDGKTAYTRRTGRIWNRPLILFGERCFFRPIPSQSETNLDRSTYRPRVEYGRLVGIRGRNNDMLFMTERVL
eukprot:6516069-Karenia_brevis.AAC.1